MILDDDLVNQRTAIEKIGDLKEEDQKKLLPQLIEVYKREGANQKEAMQYIAQFRDPGAKEIYLMELDTDLTGYARASAEALGEIGAKDAVPKMLEILAKTDKNEVKLGIIQSFGHMPTAEMVTPLLNVLKLDVDSNPIQLHDYACEVLGTLAQQDPAAMTPEAIKQITLSVFFGNMTGQSLDLACGLAIQQIGKPAVPELLAIFHGKRPDVQKLMMKYDTPKSAFPQNSPQLIAAKRLASMRATEAREPLIAWLSGKHEAPSDVTDQKAVDWRMKESQVMSEVLRGLGDLGGEGQVELLRDTVKGQRINEDAWSDVTDWKVELQLRQDAGFALNALGDRASTGILLEMADKGVINDMEKLFAQDEANGNPPKHEQRYQFNWMTLRSAAMLSTGDDIDKFQAIVSKNAEKYPALSKKMNDFIPVVQLAADCNKADGDAGKAKCYAAKLVDIKPEMREKAAWELGRLPAAVARPVVLENLGSDFLDTREILTFDLYRMPDKSTIAAIDKLLEAEKSKGGADYRLDRYRLRLLKAWLANNAK
jgi:HEAT repeat protein